MSTRGATRFVLTVVIVACASCTQEPRPQFRAANVPDYPDITPRCSNPAPLLGEHDGALEGWPRDYFFTLKPAADGRPDALLQRLKEKYPLYLIPTSASDTWSASLSREKVAALRCEPEVASIRHMREENVD